MYTLSLAAVAWSVAVTAVSETTFSLSAMPNNSTRINLVTTYARIYHKYNRSLPEALSSALQHQQGALAARGGGEAGTAIAYPSSINDGEYLIDVDVGTPPKRFRLNLDTGSSDVWVYGSAIPKSFLKGQAQYEPSQSSTSRLVPFAVWLAGYIDFSFVGGIVYKDTVSVVAAEGKGGGLTVQTQGLQVAALVARSIVQDAGMDGILGLGFDKLNFVFPTKQKTWFSNVKERLSAPLFTVDFQHRKQGKYTFGYIDKAVGPVTYTAVDASAGYWTWTSPGYAVGKQPFKARKLTGTLDTGTTIMMLPADVVEDYYAGVPGTTYSAVEHGYVFDCGAMLPDFTFGVAPDATITVPGAYIKGYGADSAPGKCIGTIQSGAGDMVVFGAPALKAGVAVFDAGNTRIGWANKTLI
ncbi:hypothetical protein LLEC1_04837 [Akanthomyces lecanii]|uniref:Peptidase A1 domain-containing protein n=1 Tax=Cordyceps confragosa TaxID=2714763 RepID=A0A179IDV0_CORDF|nr:hypothetical protein LLEC1_04837 [Akanthomyces lecanii]